MDKTVTVEEAISKGNRIVKYPAISIMIGVAVITLYLGMQKLIPGWSYPVGVALAYGMAWLWWKIASSKWQSWAFHNVRNVHELRKRAVQEILIGSDNNVIETINSQQAEDKEKLSALQNKFKQDDLFEDDFTIPNETTIYYSKRKNRTGIAIMSICLIIGICVFILSDTYIYSAITIFVGLYFGLKYFKNTQDQQPQIILNIKGIQTISTKYFKWKDIRNDQVIVEQTDRHISYFLYYEHPDGVEHLQIDNYSTNQRNLSRLLVLYRERSKRNTTNH